MIGMGTSPNPEYDDELQKNTLCLGSIICYKKVLLYELAFFGLITIAINYLLLRNKIQHPFGVSMLTFLAFVLITGGILTYLSIDFFSSWLK